MLRHMFGFNYQSQSNSHDSKLENSSLGVNSTDEMFLKVLPNNSIEYSTNQHEIAKGSFLFTLLL